MIKIKNLKYTYNSSVEGEALSDVNVEIPEGQVVMICGQSGSGKTTFIRAVNGLLSHYYEGKLEGEIFVQGKNVKETKLHDLAPIVGSVFQNPKSQFYTMLADTEIVFGCENMGYERNDILRRFDKVVTEFHIEDLLGRNLFKLSGGEKQKIACGSVAALEPKVFVLDEPTSNLDIKAIGELGEIIKTWKKQGNTVLIAEHRLNWLKGIADRVIYFNDGKIAQDMTGDDFWKLTPEAMHKMGLRAQFGLQPTQKQPLGNQPIKIGDLKIPMGSVVAVLGNCGAGKTTFARGVCGLDKKFKEPVFFGEEKQLKPKQRIKKCYMVMQDVNHQLFTSTVEEEILLGQEENEKKLAALLEEMDIVKYREAHPMALSGGQKQRVAIASALASDKEVIFYDEPTSGLDYRHMNEISESIKKLSGLHATQFVITHDPELVERCCDSFIFIEDGQVTRTGTWTEDNIQFVKDFFQV